MHSNSERKPNARTVLEPSVEKTGHAGDCDTSLLGEQQNVQHFNLHSFALDGLEHVNLM